MYSSISITESCLTVMENMGLKVVHGDKHYNNEKVQHKSLTNNMASKILVLGFFFTEYDWFAQRLIIWHIIEKLHRPNPNLPFPDDPNYNIKNNVKKVQPKSFHFRTNVDITMHQSLVFMNTGRTRRTFLCTSLWFVLKRTRALHYTGGDCLLTRTWVFLFTGYWFSTSGRPGTCWIPDEREHPFSLEERTYIRIYEFLEF